MSTITEVTLAEKTSLVAQAATLPAHLGFDAGIAGLLDHVVFASVKPDQPSADARNAEVVAPDGVSAMLHPELARN